MDVINIKKAIIYGNKELKGEITIDGAKNSVLALLPAALLVDGDILLSNVPNIQDIKSFLEIFDFLEVKYEHDSKAKELIIHSKPIKNLEVTTKLVESFRASYYLMGVLLGRYKNLVINMPGGCKIGSRPIDFHLEGFAKLGADVTFLENNILISAKALKGTEINFPRKSVGATINLIYAACYSSGQTIIKDAALEPEIDDLIAFLNVLGFEVFRKENDIVIIGKEEVLKVGKISYKVLSDRIEAMSYIILGLLGGEIKVKNIHPEHIKALLDLLKANGADLTIAEDFVIARKSTVKGFEVKTEEYPGLPTDIAQILGVLLTQGKGEFKITETIFENRFESFMELNKLGSENTFLDNSVIIKGESKLIGRTLVAKDLRGCASLVFAGLIAECETIVLNIDYMERGYSDFLDKITNLGANISIIH